MLEIERDESNERQLKTVDVQDVQTGNSTVLHDIGPGTSASYRIDTGAGIVFAEISGALTAQAMGDLRRAIGDHADFDPAFAGLFDVSEVTKIGLSFATMRDALRSPSSSSAANKGAGRIAIVVGMNLRPCRFANQLMKFWKRPMRGRVAFFPDAEDARRWLET